MNARFRRDYIYRINGKLCRYLCFDKQNKRYVFVDGTFKREDELLIAIPRERINTVAKVNKIEKGLHIGYGLTDNYKRY